MKCAETGKHRDRGTQKVSPRTSGNGKATTEPQRMSESGKQEWEEEENARGKRGEGLPGEKKG